MTEEGNNKDHIRSKRSFDWQKSYPTVTERREAHDAAGSPPLSPKDAYEKADKILRRDSSGSSSKKWL